MLDDARARRAFDLVEAALDRPPEERPAFLAAACADDPGLHAEVLALLQADQDLPTAPSPGRLAPPAPASLVGERIGPYTLTGEVGQGGMGTVYLARREDLETQVALKLVRDGRLAAQAHIQRFLLERRVLARLVHPHIARLLDAGVTDAGLPFFVMEYVAGVPLTDYCDQHRLSINRRLDLFAQAGQAVQYAHGQLVVHRDLKPSNILVAEDAEGHPQVKLLDFGIAKLLEQEEDGAALTQTGMRLMTPEYAAPEQVRGEPVTTASDVYALGVILFELLTGHRPYRFTNRSLAEIVEVVNRVEPRRPSTVVTRPETVTIGGQTMVITPEQIGHTRSEPPERLKKRLGGDLDAVVLKALRKEPERRYVSVEQLLEDLRRHRTNQPVRARRGTAGYRTGRFVRRHWAGLLVTTGLLVLLAGFGLRERTLRAEAEQARDQARIEATKAGRVSEFLVGLFETSDPNQARGDTITAREVMDRGAARITAELTNEPEAQALLMDVLGRVYENLGLYDQAAPMLEGALARRRDVLGPAHADVAASLDHLGVLRFREGAYPAAESLATGALALRRRRLGNEHPDVATSLDHLARVRLYQGDYEAADTLHRQALALRRTLLGNEHPDVATSLFNLGVVANRLGNDAEAEDFYREALALRRTLFGDVHPAVAECLDNLGAVLANQGDFDAGENFYREALALRRTLFGNEHPEVAGNLNKLAVLLAQNGDLAAAEPLLREALAMRRRLLGDEHPDVATSLFNLARLLDDKDDRPAAERLYREALAMDRKMRGDAHPHVAYDMERLALFLARDPARRAEAERLLRRSLELQRTIFGTDDPDLAYTLIELGTFMNEQDNAEEAEALLREAVQLRRAGLDDGHPETAEAEGRLGAFLAARERYDEAEPLLLESYAALRTRHDDDHPGMQAARRRLHALYTAWGRPEKAAAYDTGTPGAPPSE